MKSRILTHAAREKCQKPDAVWRSIFFRFWGEKSLFSGEWGELGENTEDIMQRNTYLLPISNKVVIGMKEKLEYYEWIRRTYPQMISKDQFYRIAHISKATALFLLSSGKIPCKDSGKKTRRYQIRTDDVIRYLIDREINPEFYRASDCWYQGRSGHYVSRVTYRNQLNALTDRERAAFRRYIGQELIAYADLLTVADVSEITGYCDTSVHRWCNRKTIKAFQISGKFLIPKVSLIEFLTSPSGFYIVRKSWKHLLLIKEFLHTLQADVKSV